MATTTIKSSRRANGAARASVNGQEAEPAPNIAWHTSAPAAVRKAESCGTATPGWTSWVKHLRERKRPAPTATLFAGKESCLFWGAAAIAPSAVGEAAAWRHGLETLLAPARANRGRLKEHVEAWLLDATAPGDPADAIEALAMAQGLPRLAGALEGDLWWAACRKLVGLAQSTLEIGDDDALQELLLRGELALALAYALPELDECRALAASGWHLVQDSVAEAFTEAGLPLADELALLRPFVASWVRSRELAWRLKLPRCEESIERRFRRAVRQMTRLARRDGSQAFSPAGHDALDPSLFRAALAGAKRADVKAARAALFGSNADASGRGLPSPACHGEDAGVWLLRRGWQRKSERLAIAVKNGAVDLELHAGRDGLVAGIWSHDVSFNGERLEVKEPWSEVCWHSDELGDYLELEAALTGGVRLQRQFFLAREDRFLYLADAVLANKSGAIEYRGSLPLAGSTTFDPASETREGFLVGAKPRGLVLPLALSEWRVEASPGRLECVEGKLELRLTAPAARRVYAPVFIDLDPRRIRRPATWRRLTVAENREIQPRDVAVGYRVETQAAQWLIYRSLDDRGNRTLLGHNLVSESLIARFRDGAVDALLEIE